MKVKLFLGFIPVKFCPQAATVAVAPGRGGRCDTLRPASDATWRQNDVRVSESRQLRVVVLVV